jgi:S-DNA-T family DNA segregation ATPase FtsK/SpoIIIE
LRVRFTVTDRVTDLHSDVVVECDPSDPVEDVLKLVSGSLPVRGTPLVHGAPLAGTTPLASSALREGAELVYGGAAPAGAPDPFARPSRDGYQLRVVSGPSAGRSVAVLPDGTVTIGRGTDNDLVLADPDASRRHAELRGTADGFVVADLGSANGVSVEGAAVAGSRAVREGDTLQVGVSRMVLEHAGRSAAVLTRGAEGNYLLNRRFPDRREPFTAPRVALPAPPPEDEQRGLPLLAMVLPLGIAVVLALVMGSPLYLLFGLLSPAMMLGNWWSDRRRRRSRGRRQLDAYRDKLVAARAEVQASVEDEDADLRRRLPDPITIARTALQLRRELWTRRPGADDWLLVRLGTADRPPSVTVTGERPPGWTEPLLRQVPVGVDLDALGVVGLAGPQPWLQDRLAWVLCQLAVLHSPDELRMTVLAPGAGEQLGWLRWLPHLRAGDGLLAAWDESGVEDNLRALGEQLDRRAAQPLQQRAEPPGQLLVVLVGAGQLIRRPQVLDLLARGGPLGFRFLCADSDDRLLPDSCRAVLSVDDGRSLLRVDQGQQRELLVDGLPAGMPERIARTFAPLRRVGDLPAGGLPEAVRFTDLAPSVEADELRAHWRLQPERTAVVVGRDADGQFELDIARHGPHAVVAGTSGSGKSELLQTWVAALALANSPLRLSVIFMDYKGGAAFRDLVGLPHVVGTVTNLDQRLAERALASLRAELTRRQQQLTAADATDREDYLRRAADSGGAALPAFPRLLIVVDELAELKEQLPELVEGLVGVARIGRSLGVHLVLATQKPGGVVDAQIRANVDLRVCLRTRDAGESTDVIEVPDAARISKNHPGRALVVRGGGTAVAVQTARVTTPVADDVPLPRRAVPVDWDAVAVPAPPRPETAGLGTDLQQLVESVAAAADAEGLAAPHHPWAPPLPEILTLDELPPAPGALLLGLRDRPEAQLREPLQVPLGSGHLAVIGSGRTGRTAALRGIAAALARTHPPTELHVHAIDGASGLAGLTALPNVGVVAVEEDHERLERLLVRLSEEVRGRRRMLAERGAASTSELGAEAPPPIVLLVDDWQGVVEGDGPAQNALRELLGGAASAAGVTVVLAGDERLLRGRVLSRVSHRLCLRLNTPADATVLGLSVRRLPDGLPPGRGLWALDGTEVQVPLLSAAPDGMAQATELAELGERLRAAHGEPAGERAPLRLDPLPFPVAAATAAALPAIGSGDIVLGVAGDRLGAVRTQLSRELGAVLIAGPARSGRSTAAAGIAATAAAAGSRTLLVAPRRVEPHRAAERAGVSVIRPPELAARLAADEPQVVVIDDADAATFDDALVVRLTGPDGPALVVAGLLDAFGFPRGLLAAAKKGAGPVVLLCPPNHLAAENVGIQIERGAGFTGPPGRALLRSAGGEPLLGQVPELPGENAAVS